MHRVTFVVCDSIVYTSFYAISEPLTCRVHTHTHRARELLSAGVLDPRDKPPAAEFKERATIPGVPQLPTGYVFTQWIRCAVSFLSCVTIHPFGSYTIHVYRAPTTRARVHLHVPTTHQWCRLSLHIQLYARWPHNPYIDHMTGSSSCGASQSRPVPRPRLNVRKASSFPSRCATYRRLCIIMSFMYGFKHPGRIHCSSVV